MKILTRRKFQDIRHFVCSQLHACTQTPLAAFCHAAPPLYVDLSANLSIGLCKPLVYMYLCMDIYVDPMWVYADLYVGFWEWVYVDLHRPLCWTMWV